MCWSYLNLGNKGKRIRTSKWAIQQIQSHPGVHETMLNVILFLVNQCGMEKPLEAFSSSFEN